MCLLFGAMATSWVRKTNVNNKADATNLSALSFKIFRARLPRVIRMFNLLRPSEAFVRKVRFVRRCASRSKIVQRSSYEDFWKRRFAASEVSTDSSEAKQRW